jgi:hypothetical protein
MAMRRGTAAFAAGAIVLALASDAFAQAIPRTADGKPDVSGIWQAVNSAAWNILPHSAEPGVPAGIGVVEGDEIPYRPEAAAKQRENYAGRATLDPEAKCWLPGVPRATYMGLPFQIVQTPSQVSILYEYAHALRNVYMNSPHPKGPIEFWMGDSRGRWEGDTLVVDVVHFNDQTWFDRAGNHHSEELHVVERYSPVDRNHINYEVTIEDPKVFTRPWKMSMPLYRRLDRNMQILEYECSAFDEAFRTGPAER